MGTPLGVFLRHRRDQLGMDRKTLAELSGLSYPYISQLESSADKRPSERALRLLAPALQLDLEKLLRVAEGWTSEGSPAPGRRNSSPEPQRREEQWFDMAEPLAMRAEMAIDDVDQARRELLPRLARRLDGWSPVAQLAVLQELQARALDELRRGQ